MPLLGASGELTARSACWAAVFFILPRSSPFVELRVNPRAGGKRKRTPWLRLVVTVAALLAIAVPLVASRMRQEPPMITVPDTGGAYVEAAIRNPDYLNPILLQYNQVDRDLCALIFSGLTRLDEHGSLYPTWPSDGRLGMRKSYLFRLKAFDGTTVPHSLPMTWFYRQSHAGP